MQGEHNNFKSVLIVNISRRPNHLLKR